MVISFILNLKIFGSSTWGVVLFFSFQFGNINVTALGEGTLINKDFFFFKMKPTESHCCLSWSLL